MKKMLYIMPVLFLLAMVSCMAAFSVTWGCPVSGSGTSSTVKNYMVYEDSPPYSSCLKSGNNFTIEYQVVGTGNDWEATEGSSIDLRSVLYIDYGNVNKLTLPLNSNFTNTSATTSDLQRWVDFGKLYTSGNVGFPKWYNNLTDGSYKWYIVLTNNSNSAQVLSTTTGFASGYPVQFTVSHVKSPGIRLAAAVQGGVEVSPEAQALVGGVTGVPSKKVPVTVIAMLVLVVIYLVAFRKK